MGRMVTGPIPGSTSWYEVLGQLGQGEMAEVFLARHHLAHEDGAAGAKLVALKQLRPELAGDPTLQEMLVTEARLGAGFNHPNLAEAFDLGQHDGRAFFTMEWVAGHELGHLARAADASSGSMPLLSALTVVVALAAALDYAHELKATNGSPFNLVHLDVSPANVLVDPQGFVKLVDFGIAQHDLSPRQPWRSQAGLSKDLGGTIAYRSPEHCIGGSIDRRSDVFSLGVILWELTVWSRLFQGSSDAEIQTKIVTQDAPPPSTVRQNFPDELEAIIMQALARDPNDRFANARALLVALEEFAYAHQCAPSTTRLGQYVRELMPQGAPLVATAEGSHNTNAGHHPTLPEHSYEGAVPPNQEETSVDTEPMQGRSVTFVPTAIEPAAAPPRGPGVPDPIPSDATSGYSVAADKDTPPMGSPRGSGSGWRR